MVRVRACLSHSLVAWSGVAHKCCMPAYPSTTQKYRRLRKGTQSTIDFWLFTVFRSCTLKHLSILQPTVALLGILTWWRCDIFHLIKEWNMSPPIVTLFALAKSLKHQCISVWAKGSSDPEGDLLYRWENGKRVVSWVFTYQGNQSVTVLHLTRTVSARGPTCQLRGFYSSNIWVQRCTLQVVWLSSKMEEGWESRFVLVTVLPSFWISPDVP